MTSGTITIELWQLVTFLVGLLVAVLTGIAGLGQVFYSTLNRRLISMDDARQHDMGEFRQMLGEHARASEARMARVGALDAELQHYRNLQGERWEKIGDRVARVEQSQSAAIGHHDLSNLHERINSVSKELAQLHGELSALGSLVRTIDSYLRDKSNTQQGSTAHA